MSAAEQAATLRFAAALAERTAELPSAYYDVSPHRTGTLRVDVFAFDAFEQWREALGIPTGDVGVQQGASQATMHARCECPGGITVQLTGYSSPVVAR